MYNKDNLELLYAPKGIKDFRKSLYEKAKKVAIAIAKKEVTFRIFSRKVLFNSRENRYIHFRDSIKTDDKTIVFCTFDGRSYGDSPKAIYEYMLEHIDEYENYKFVWAFRNPKKFTYLLDNDNTYLTQVNTVEYEKTLAMAKFWVYNYRVADHIYPRKDQIYIQLWHGTPLKRLGFDIKISDNAMNSKEEIRDKYVYDAMKFRYILAPSDFAADKFSSAWNLSPEKRAKSVVTLGYPRNDFLINYKENDIENIKSELGIPEDKKVILYAPTWRDNQHQAGVGYTYKTEVDFDKLRDELQDEYVILFRAHYLVASSFEFEKYEGFVYNVSDVNDINHLYVISNLLITDYSSVFFDYANLKRPEIFYMYDKEAYGDEIRGFYIDLNELPGPIVETEDELIKEIKNIKENVFDEKYQRFNDKFNYLDDGNASKRVVDLLLNTK